MRTVWKFELFSVDDDVRITMPMGAKILHVEAQREVPCVWALVDPGADKVEYRFRLAGTGHPLPDDVGPHVGSFMLHGGRFVFHLFEVRSPTREGGT